MLRVVSQNSKHFFRLCQLSNTIAIKVTRKIAQCNQASLSHLSITRWISVFKYISKLLSKKKQTKWRHLVNWTLNLIYSVLYVISKNEINFYWPKGATVRDFLTSKESGWNQTGQASIEKWTHYLSKLILWWCCPPAFPRPPGCFLCFPTNKPREKGLMWVICKIKIVNSSI